MAVVRSLTANAVLKTEQFESGAQKVQRSLRDIRTSTSDTAKAFEDISRSMANVAASVVSIQAIGNAVRNVISETTKLNQLANAFTAITGSAEEAQRTLKFVGDTANRIGVNVNALADSFKQISAAAKGTALEGDGVKSIFTAISEASRVLGLTSEQTSRALLAIGQSISKNAIQSEELRGQLGEVLPAAAQVMARALGVSSEKLNDMLEKGELKGRAMTNAWLLFAQQYRREFGGAIADASSQAEASFARLENATIAFSQSLGKDLTPALGQVAEAFAKFISLGDETAGTLGQALAPVIRQTGAAALALASGVILAGKGIAALGAFASEGMSGLNVALADMKDFSSKMDKILEQLLNPPPLPAKLPKPPTTIESLTGGTATGTDAVGKAAAETKRQFEDWLSPLEQAKKRLHEIQQELEKLGKSTGTSIPGAGIGRAPAHIAAILNREAPKFGIDPRFAEAIMKTESNFDPNAVSPKGAVGLMQIMPANFKALGITDPRDITQNIVGSLRLLQELNKTFSGDLEKISQAYHSGPAAARSGLLGPEGREYAPKVLGNLRSFIADTPTGPSGDERIDQLRKEAKELREFIAITEMTTKADELQADTIEARGQKLTDLIEKLKDHNKILQESEIAQIRDNVSRVQGFEGSKLVIDQLLNEANARREVGEALKREAVEYERLGEIQKEQAEAQEKRDKVLLDFRRRVLKEREDEAKKMADEQERLAKEQEKLGGQTLDFFDDLLQAAKRGGDAWVEFGERVANSLLRMLLQATGAEQQLGKIVQTGINAVLKLLGIGVPSFGTDIPGAIPASTGVGIGMAAKGGEFSAGRTVLVGEEGPELIRFRENGTVIPNNQIHNVTYAGAQSMASAHNTNYGGSVTSSSSSVVHGGMAPIFHVNIQTQDANSFNTPQSRSQVQRGLVQAWQAAQRSA